ncbi:cupin domain-containing protein [Bacillus salipaludis]|uniref:Cupin domain-containing protein n=1 Tax=Bacillus salipaludis TaxID=2547811 RepID=A0A4R5VIJ3_9BACI|nr:cupin domain-containing protein [Bacillus salipaludis]MDQ6598944.1 cupin domain-containing protein [Bacillus salipaludis]TDK56217.1 cupin domain-containing protein [Bacillus salipaludis]
MKIGQLEVFNLHKLIQDKTEYTNFIVSEVNDHALRIAVINGEFHWHKHEDCDELFYVLEGELFIDLENNETVSLKPGEIFTVPANTMHRTSSNERTVNLCFEKSSTNING